MINEKKIDLKDVGTVRLVKHKKTRRIKISVKPGEVKVTIPVSLSFRAGEEFAVSKREWIKKVQRKIPSNNLIVQNSLTGELFKSRKYLYKLEPSDIDFLKIRYIESRDTILFQYPQKLNIESPELQKALKYGIDEMLRIEAKEYLPGRVHDIGTKMKFRYKKVFIKNNKTNWGSCSTLGNINLNLHLVRLPDKLIDFIIVHELLHTKIPNHGPQFKETMNRIFPDSVQLNKQLKKYSPHRYIKIEN